MIVKILYCLSSYIVVSPMIDQISSDQSLVIGTTELLNCDATGSDDSVSLVWRRADGEPLDDSRIIQTPFGSLRLLLDIQNVGIADEGTYVCTATNPDGVATTDSVSVTVIGMKIPFCAIMYSITILIVPLYRTTHIHHCPPINN